MPKLIGLKLIWLKLINTSELKIYKSYRRRLMVKVGLYESTSIYASQLICVDVLIYNLINLLNFVQ